MSSAQLVANRRNAQKSTGPKSAAGKDVSKLNALKHGVLAQSVVVRGHQFKESPNDFKKLCREFYASLAPAGPLEELLVDQIVQASWRLRRARTAESGEIVLSVDAGHNRRQRINPRQQWSLWRVWGDPVSEMQNSAMGNSILASWLREVRARVEQEGELSEAAIKIPFHGEPNQLAKDLETIRQQFPPPPEGAEDAARRADAKAKILTAIDRKLRLLEWSCGDCQQREDVEEQARQAAAVLPADATLEKILRYETALERQLYRAMNQLERLQRRRSGENIPAPLTMDISSKV